MPRDKITYCFFDSPLGDMIAGATTDGVSFLEWTDRGGIDRILRRVEKRYRLPLEEGDNKHLKFLRRELEKYFVGSLSEFKVPLDVTGTSFEMLDWEQLLAIPYGVTRSYGDIAKALGRPGAPRAVGRANGANYLSIVIPCHRVINANGQLHGYGGGLWRKKWLLELESGVDRLDL